MNTDTKVFGFWIYLMTDLIIFAVLFAAFGVLHGHVFGGPSGGELFSVREVFAETMILLTSSFTCALGTYALLQGSKKWVLVWFTVTFLLGVSFLGLEVSEFFRLVHEGNSWRRSAFLSSFFTLVGTHGFHITVGLLWMFVMLCRVGCKGLMDSSASQLYRLALFWHFLDIVWIFIFTVVYGIGRL